MTSHFSETTTTESLELEPPRKAIVIGGFVDGAIDDVEVLDYDDGQSLACDAIPDYPVEVFGATGALIDGRVKVCGGGFDVNSLFYNSCYDYDPEEGEWLKAESLQRERIYPSSSLIGNEWFVSGGYVGLKQYRSSWFIQNAF